DHSHHADHGLHPSPMAMPASHQGHAGHASMADDFRRRFWISLALTIPVLATSEMVQHLLGLRGVLTFPGARYVEFGFASAVYLYGRSEEHTSELQSRSDLVCRLLLEKK